MATDHVVEEGEACSDQLCSHGEKPRTLPAEVVMDSLGQMKKLSKWAIFENQAGGKTSSDLVSAPPPRSAR